MFSLQQRFHLCENSQILAPRCIFSINGQDHLSGNYLDKHGTNGHCDEFSQAPRNDFCKFNREAEVYLKTETRLCYNFLRFSSFPTQVPVFCALIICSRQRLSMDTGDHHHHHGSKSSKMAKLSCHHHHQAPECRPSRFRKIDGSCNSRVNSNYGRTGNFFLP